MSRHLTYQAMNHLRIYAFMRTLSGIHKIMRGIGINYSAVRFTRKFEFHFFMRSICKTCLAKVYFCVQDFQVTDMILWLIWLFLDSFMYGLMQPLFNRSVA